MANINKVALLNNGKVVGAGRNKDNSNLAPIEATTTASRSYLVGDYLMLQGEFYKVIQTISIGNALVVGTNIQATNVGKELHHGLVELWKNSNISSAFAGQTINISNFDVNLYDSIVIVIEPLASETLSANWYEIDVDSLNSLSSSISFRYMTMNDTAISQIYRAITSVTLVNDVLSLVFDDGHIILKTYTSNTPTTTTNNERMIPVRILGLIHNS